MDKKVVLENLEEIKNCIEQFYTRNDGMKIDKSLEKFSGLIQVMHLDILYLIKMINEEPEPHHIRTKEEWNLLLQNAIIK